MSSKEEWDEDLDYEDNCPPEVTSPTAFATIPRWLYRIGISDRAFKLYCILAQMQGSRGKESHPSRATLVRMTGSSVRSVARALAELEEWGAIKIVERFRPDGGRASSSYVIYYHNPVENEPGTWTDTPLTTPQGHQWPTPLGHEWPMPRVTGGLPKNNNLSEEEPNLKNKVSSPTATPPRTRSSRKDEPKVLSQEDTDALIEKWEHRWPIETINRHIERALNHTASRKAINLRRYVDTWLRKQEEYDFKVPGQQASGKGIPLVSDRVSATDWDL